MYLTSIWNMRIKGNIMKYVSYFNSGFIWLSIWRIAVKVQIYWHFLTLLLNYSFFFSACNLWCQKAGESQKEKKKKSCKERIFWESSHLRGERRRVNYLLGFLMAALSDFYMCVCLCAQSLQSCLTLVTPWTVARQARLSMELPGKNSGHVAIFSFRWSSDPRIKSTSLVSSTLAGRFLPLCHLESPYGQLVLFFFFLSS